jgi:class 3 adenylate cyclase
VPEPEQPPPEQDPESEERSEDGGGWKRFTERLRRLNENQKLVDAARGMREKLPGDQRVGDRLSTAQNRPTDLAVRQLADSRGERPGLAGELGLGAVQVWQALAESQGRGRGEVEVTIMFTDLSGFSSWALDAGDDIALELLREVGEAIEPPVASNHGDVVKRLGDGLMAAFGDAPSAVDAALEARERAASILVEGYRPRLRTGIHLGKPRKVGGDYFGVDVNIAARLVEAAGPDEILVSDTTLPQLDDAAVVAKKRRFRAKGAPKDLSAHTIERAG